MAVRLSSVSGNTYTGITNVSNGTLLINNSYTGGGAVSVLSGGTLGGVGTITTSGLTVSNGGVLAPGGTTGTLKVAGNVSLNGTLSIELAGASLSRTVDLLDDSTGTLTIDSTTGKLVFNQPTDWDGQPYVIAIYGSLIGQFAESNIVGLNSSQTLDYNFNGLNQIAVVPEPVTCVTFGLFGGSILVRRRLGRQK